VITGSVVKSSDSSDTYTLLQSDWNVWWYYFWKSEGFVVSRQILDSNFL